MQGIGVLSTRRPSGRAWRSGLRPKTKTAAPKDRRFNFSNRTFAQLVCWIADSIQVELFGRTNVQSSVASIG